MESKDLKNSEELKRPLSDDSELTNEAANSASSAVNDVVDETLTTENDAADLPGIPEDAGIDEVEPESAELTDAVGESSILTEPVREDGLESQEEPAAENNVELQVEAVEPLEEPAENSVETQVEAVDPSEEPVAENSVEPQDEAMEEPMAIQSGETAITASESTESAEESPSVTEVESAETISIVDSPEPVQEKVVVEESADLIARTDSHEEDIPADEEEDEEDHADYTQLSQIDLVNLLRELVDNDNSPDRKINLVITAFNLKVKENIADKKKQFVEEGGNPDEFTSEEDPYENDIRELVKKHRQAKFEQGKRMEAEKETNLQRKYTIIEDIKNLLNKEESINKTFQEFRELQKLWYELGPVPQAKMKDLWDTYHFHVENFYDYIKINKELRDLDLKKNLEIKISLCERAEELLIEPSVIRAFNTLQKFHEQWREIGPVPRDKKDEIWDRFKAVTTAINQKHQDFFEKRKVEQKRNLDAKIALCEKVEEIYSMDIDSHRDWDEKSKQLIELQKIWRTIGFAPKRDNNRIYDRFRNACDQFFNKKRDFYSQNKDVQNKNMQMKIDLCMEAEALKENDDWKKTTQQFIDVQKRWKEVGPVPRKHSDLLWKRFRAACDYFFDRKSEHFSDIDDEQSVNLNAKKTLIEEVENFVPGADVAQALKVLREFQRKWTEIGHVPIREKDEIQNRFRSAINKHFDTLKVDSSKRESINFRSKIANMTDNQRGLSKVRQEREKYMAKLKQLETDLILLDNNIGFFANSKNAQALIADVNQKIEDTREKIEQLKDKIRIIDDLDKTEY
jgi:hypothetical protein